jgi:Flp pilus assembly protein TadG
MGRFVRDTRGQSLVETALVLPLLLILVLGIADLGRLGYYSIAVSQATRNAAAYAAVNPSVPIPELQTRLQSRVCDELRLGTGCVQLPTISRLLDTKVSVTYQFTLITGVIAQRFGAGSIPLTAQATFPGYTQ